MNPHSLAWQLIEGCPWKLNTPEMFVVLKMAEEHAKGQEWVLSKWLAHHHNGGSATNMHEMLHRHRINTEQYPFFESMERKSRDGKTRTYYKLRGYRP
jgi:hypothetical protein